MKQLKYLAICLLLTFGSTGLFAQEHDIDFGEKTHNFGDLKKGDKAEHVFTFKNTSDHPVKLTNVKASCGCTTPNWTREEVEPGKEGEIKVSYNSNRIGPFNKSVTVQYENGPSPLILYIKGKVEAPEGGTPVVSTPPKKPAINYSIPRGGVSFEKMIENLREINSEETRELRFRFRNTGNKVLKITDKVEADPEFTLKPEHKVLQPGQESMLNVYVDGKKMRELNRKDGYFSKRIAFYTDEEGASAKKQVTINGNYKRVFSQAEKDNSPRIEFVETSVNGGKVIEGEQFVYDFEFTNTGKSPLTISQAKASCGCTATKPPQGSIAPGESGKITATFNSKGRPGKQSKTITVVSDDIDNGTVVLRFTVEVVKDPFHAGGMMGGSE